MKPILATDLDGTLIPLDPLPADDPQHQALESLRQCADSGRLELIFVTGRHCASVLEVMRAKGLPTPKWIICDVGTSIFHRENDDSEPKPYRRVPEYVNHLDRIVDGLSTEELAKMIRCTDDLRLQEREKQGRHKLSFYCDARRLGHHVESILGTLEAQGAPYRIVHSVDPFNADGLIDLLPTGIDKGAGLKWWAEHRRIDAERIVFAGDSGNDYAAFVAGFRTIVVGNADRDLARQVSEHHRQAGTEDHVYLAQGYATAGVLEGCCRFGLVAFAS